MAFAVGHGLPTAHVERLVGTSLKKLQPGDRLPASKLIGLFDRVSDSNPTLAVSVAMATFGAVSFGSGLARTAQFAPTVRDALALFARFGSLIMDGLRLHFDETATTGVVTASHPMNEVDEGRLVELLTAQIWRFVTTNTASSCTPTQVHIHASRTDFRHAYQSFFKAPVSFTHKHRDTVLVLSSAALRTPLRFHCAEVFEQLTADHATQLHGLRTEDSLKEFARLEAAAQANAERGIYEVGALAKTAGMSVRTAQRLAARVNLSLRDFLTQGRIDAAKRRLLSQPELTIAELAKATGYSNERSFRRAFKRCTGVSPIRFRRQHR